MRRSLRTRAHAALGALTILGAVLLAGQAAAYNFITPTMANRTVTLTGKDLTVEEVVAVARYGAKIQISPEAKQRNADTWGLLIQGAAENMPVYLFNRGGGNQREVPTFAGDPLSEENRAYFATRTGVLPEWQPPTTPPGPFNPSFAEFDDEDIGRAIMVVRINQMTWLPSSPAILQAHVDLMNAGITPVMRARGGTGEALGPTSGNITTTVRGGGEAYYRGQRMSSAEALRRAGLKPTPTMPGDNTTGTVNADVAGMSALLVHDAKQLLDWIDLAYAVDLNGMNSSITPLFQPNRVVRPYRWINWNQERVLGMLRGSYLLNDEGDSDPKIKRIIQDPESMRAGYVRAGAAWEEWGNLRDAVTVQMNWTEHNPVALVGAKPTDSWELSSPWAMKYFVKGGPRSNGKSGFIFSNANWDPYPLGNRLEAFNIALANLDVAVMLRQERFRSTFFTVVTANEILGPPPPGQQGGNIGGSAGVNHEVWQKIQGYINPVPPEGYCLDADCVEELDAETLFKIDRSQRIVMESWTLVANDFTVGSRWMDIRKAQRPNRTFGAAPTAAVAALRASGKTPYDFVRTTPAATFIGAGPPIPPMVEPAVQHLNGR